MTTIKIQDARSVVNAAIDAGRSASIARRGCIELVDVKGPELTAQVDGIMNDPKVIRMARRA